MYIHDSCASSFIDFTDIREGTSFHYGGRCVGKGGDQNKKENNIAPPLFIDMPQSQGNDWSYICDLGESIVCFYDSPVG